MELLSEDSETDSSEVDVNNLLMMETQTAYESSETNYLLAQVIVREDSLRTAVSEAN
jgi:hypothetical protein